MVMFKECVGENGNQGGSPGGKGSSRVPLKAQFNWQRDCRKAQMSGCKCHGK
jgi:hypothetical protein